MKEVILKHWQQGGTGVTNITEPMLRQFTDAVAEYGDPQLVIHDAPFDEPPMEGQAYAPIKSLHDLSDERSDLSAFWARFEELNFPFAWRRRHMSDWLKTAAIPPPWYVKQYNEGMQGVSYKPVYITMHDGTKILKIGDTDEALLLAHQIVGAVNAYERLHNAADDYSRLKYPDTTGK